MPEMMIENHMVVDPEREERERMRKEAGLPECSCCNEKIRQEEALHILSGRKRIWICNRCIEDLKEPTGYGEE